VSFTAPASDGGSPITGYTVTSSPAGITVNGTSSPITVTGLMNGIPYTFTVTATNSVGDSPASAPSSAVTPIITKPPTPIIRRRVTLDVSPYFRSDLQPGSFYVESTHNLVITLTPLPTLPAGYEPKVTTNRISPPDDKGGVTFTLNDDGTYTVRIARIQQNITVTVGASFATANENIPSTARAWGYGQRLYIAAGANDGQAYIYNMTGVLVKILPYVSGETVFTTLPAGIYVVTMEGRRDKVVIRN
jgi:hypothetical protein